MMTVCLKLFYCVLVVRQLAPPNRSRSPFCLLFYASCFRAVRPFVRSSVSASVKTCSWHDISSLKPTVHEQFLSLDFTARYYRATKIDRIYDPPRNCVIFSRDFFSRDKIARHQYTFDLLRWNRWNAALWLVDRFVDIATQLLMLVNKTRVIWSNFYMMISQYML